MARYDFKSLSHQDFEELVRDLLQAEWSVSLESFKAGRDSGIDLRYAPAIRDGKTIVQCKHYATTGVGGLIANLRNQELPKIAKLAPDRYVVATSVGLTPANKEEIASSLSPYVCSTGDILGADELNGLLTKHPEVEKSHFKLWLTSAVVLERVLHNAEVCQTEFEIDRIRRKLPLFVQHQALPRAQEILDRTRVLIISGSPGIGKTTLAEMLMFSHLSDGYEPVVIQSNITEGKRLVRKSAKQIFYFDDFLGQTFLGDRPEYTGQNQDRAIVDFIEMVQASENSRFILTTREHILSSALQISERLARSAIVEHRCVLELADYSKRQRARILYNHLYFSDLPEAHKEEFLKDDFFLRIVEHQHFSPRLIEWLSGYQRVRFIPATSYQGHVIALMDSPEEVWSHAFKVQISEAARDLILTLYTVGERVIADRLEEPFAALHQHRSVKYNFRTSPDAFYKALQEIEGAFISISGSKVSFLNPSVREFAASLVSKSNATLLDLLRSATLFKQVAALGVLIMDGSRVGSLQDHRDRLALLGEAVTRTIESPQFRVVKFEDRSVAYYDRDSDFESRSRFVARFAEKSRIAAGKGMFQTAARLMIKSWERHNPDFSDAISLLRELSKKPWLLERGGKDAYQQILSALVPEYQSARAWEIADLLKFVPDALYWTDADDLELHGVLARYRSHGLKDEWRDCRTLGDLSNFRDTLEELSDKHGISLAEHIESLNEEIDKRETARSFADDEGGGWGHVDRSVDDSVSNEELRDLFSTLRQDA